MLTIDFEVPCARCERSLLGVGFDGTCPACGLLVEESLELSLVNTADLTGCRDRACIHCDYALAVVTAFQLHATLDRAIDLQARSYGVTHGEENR